jgi:hypothetical protein
MTEQFLFLEMFNESPLWQYKCEYVQSVYTMNTYRFTVKVSIEADKLLLPDFLNSSLALNSLISTIFDDGKQHPLFDKTDFSSKSFVSYEEPINPPNNFKIKFKT